MNAYALTTVARAKTFLGITSSAYDTLLERLIDSASDFVERYCDRRFKKTTYTNELYDGSGTAALLLKQFPVISSESFTLQERAGTDNISSFSTISSNLFFVKYNQGIIEFTGGVFRPYPQIYRLTYTAGYDFDNTTPGATLESVGLGDLEYAVWKLVGNAFNERKTSGNVQSESIGNYSVTYRRDLEMSPELKGILDKYRRIVIV